MIWEHLRSRGSQSITQETVTERASPLDASVTPPSAMDAYELDLDRARRRDADRRAVARRVADDLSVNAMIVDAAVQSIEATAERWPLYPDRAVAQSIRRHQTVTQTFQEATVSL